MTVQYNSTSCLVIDGVTYPKAVSEAVAEVVRTYNEGDIELESLLIQFWYRAWNSGFIAADENSRQSESMGR